MPLDAEDWADLIAQGIAVAMAPIAARLKAAEAMIEDLRSELRTKALQPGIVGPMGPMGEKGLDGAVGPQGPPGPVGPMGEAGLPGAVGERGEAGPAGPAGDPGRDGRDGQPGVQGPKGLDGISTNGIDGRDGKDGADGLGFDDLGLTWDDDGRPLLRFVRGELVKDFRVGGAYREVWRAGERYLKGDTATFGGSLFIAREDTTDKPETSSAWRLAVKHGREGKPGTPGTDGKPGAPGPRGKDGEWR